MDKTALLVIIVAVLLIANITQFIQPPGKEIVVEKQLIKGDPITVKDTVRDTVYIDKIVKVKADSVQETDTSCYAKADFELSEDSTSVSGVVAYEDSIFTFTDVKILFPKINTTITRVDTLLEKTTITKNIPFYRNGWFYSTIATISILVLVLLGGLQ